MTTATERLTLDSRTLLGQRPVEVALYLTLGVVFGIILTKTEVISWYRIQEMFRFQGFHMYGVIGSALVVAAASVALIQRTRLKTILGADIQVEIKPFDRGINQWAGGILFGFGWALTGACPGPLYALIGGGMPVFIVPLLSAIAGTWAYGALRHRLPH
ncbi:MAG: DUF6691 family protein [Rhodothermales bacterium]|nr:DUF6691 family protein [Rhodothermales bacterium]